jgi:hypothetical protein
MIPQVDAAFHSLMRLVFWLHLTAQQKQAPLLGACLFSLAAF